MKNINPPYRPIFIPLTTIAIVIAISTLTFYSYTHDYRYQNWIFPIAISIFPFGLKLAAPNIPFSQVIFAALCVILLNAVFGYFATNGWLVIGFFGDKIIETICILGFGAYWVKKKYIPGWANQW